MRLIRDIADLPAAHTGAVVALGNFDGLHLGHRSILEETLREAKQCAAPAGLVTFEPHPREFFSPDTPKLRLMGIADKIIALRGMGFAVLYMLRFNASLATTGAERFVQHILVSSLGVRGVVTGENFHFGAQRAGNSAFLAHASQEHGFSYRAMPAVVDEGGIISSSRIRSLLAEGKVEETSALLGRPYSISGHVAHGDKRGRTLGFPTANVKLHDYFLPRHGVYAVRAHVGWNWYKGVANLGVRPTVGGKKPRAEIHLFDFSGDIYGKKMHVELRSFLRDEQTFASLDALKNQIHLDCEQARHDD